MATYRYKVEGRGQFPFDMLRYDCCWPSYPEDVDTLGQNYTWGDTWVIQLTSHFKPSYERWLSFNCKVAKLEVV